MKKAGLVMIFLLVLVVGCVCSGAGKEEQNKQSTSTKPVKERKERDLKSTVSGDKSKIAKSKEDQQEKTKEEDKKGVAAVEAVETPKAEPVVEEAVRSTGNAEESVVDNTEAIPSVPEQREPQHIHNWVWNQESGHYEQVLVEEGRMSRQATGEWITLCNSCGLDITNNMDHVMRCGNGAYHNEPVYEEIWTEPIYRDQWIVDSAGYYFCSECGVMK